MSTIQFSTVLPWCVCMCACVCMNHCTHLSTQLLHLQNDGSYDLQCPGVDSQPAWTHSQCRTHCLDIWVQHLVQMLRNSQQRHLKPKQNLLCVKLLSRTLGCSILSVIRIVHLTLIATEPIKWSLFTSTHTFWRKLKLSTDNCSICSIPRIITNSAPLVVETDFNSSLSRVSSITQSYITILTKS